jgi:hypothetical protein
MCVCLMLGNVILYTFCSKHCCWLSQYPPLSILVLPIVNKQGKTKFLFKWSTMKLGHVTLLCAIEAESDSYRTIATYVLPMVNWDWQQGRR